MEPCTIFSQTRVLLCLCEPGIRSPGYLFIYLFKKKKKDYIYIYTLHVLRTVGRTTTWEEMPRIRWATIKPLGSKEVVVTITLLIDELFIYWTNISHGTTGEWGDS